ncbi:MAG TPA: SAM-dependent methyltransferase [Opitutaceae bacterium]|nr:SAM-dependent methyltransferase [Opitutaceae bacterium]
MFFTCQAGFEAQLGAEVAAARLGSVDATGPGWLRLGATAPGELPELCFAHRVHLEPVEIVGEGVNALAGRLCDWFMGALRGERIEGSWPNVWQAPIEIPGLGRRLGAVEAEFGALLKKRLSRVAKLAQPELPRGTGTARGLFVFATDFGRLHAARTVWLGGQRRMADDSAAPSRSYLKTEEAYVVLGREPAEGETVADLGAAPGGWSYSAAKRGARVVAIDNGPLKGGALDHPLIEHRREDAFRFRPAAGERYDWLFCDMVEDPRRVLDLVAQWTHGRWCRHFVVNLKFGHADALALLDQVRHSSESPLRDCAVAHVRHLFHDREEFTLVGSLRD